MHNTKTIHISDVSMCVSSCNMHIFRCAQPMKFAMICKNCIFITLSLIFIAYLLRFFYGSLAMHIFDPIFVHIFQIHNISFLFSIWLGLMLACV